MPIIFQFSRLTLEYFNANQERVEDFVRWLHSPEVQAASKIRRFANLVLKNLDAIVETNRQRSQRSILLAHLAKAELTQLEDACPELDVGTFNQNWPWKRLHELTVGRGYRNSEPFELQKGHVFFYGPNGSGKSSSGFCHKNTVRSPLCQ